MSFIQDEKVFWNNNFKGSYIRYCIIYDNEDNIISTSRIVSCIIKKINYFIGKTNNTKYSTSYIQKLLQTEHLKISIAVVLKNKRVILLDNYQY